MAPLNPPLDEIIWQGQYLLDNWRATGDIHGRSGTVDTNNILVFFSGSNFFDPFSNNAILTGQASQKATRAEFEAIIYNRKHFEQQLLATFKSNFHYILAAEPKAPGEPWVIYRQHWYKKMQDDGSVVDALKVTGVYYVHGTIVRMAPTLADVVRTRLQSVATNLDQVFSLSQTLTHFTPSTRHTYFPPGLESSKQSGPPGTTSRAGSIGPSEVDASQATAAISQTSPEASTTQFSDSFFIESLRLTNRYGHEFSDENPITGEPGAFVLSSTAQAVEARKNKAQAQAQAQAAQQASQASTATGPVGAGGLVGGVQIKQESQSVVSSVAPTPKPLPLDAAGSRKGSVAGLPKGSKKERRKSKGLASPISPPGP